MNTKNKLSCHIVDQKIAAFFAVASWSCHAASNLNNLHYVNKRLTDH